MPKFSFTHHRTNSRHWSKSAVTVKSHTLELYTPHRTTGKPNKAILVFDAELDSDRLGSIVGYVTGDDSTGCSIVGWFPLEAFDAYREILVKGGELSVHYELRDSGASEGYLRRLGIGESEKILTVSNVSHAPNAGAPAAVFAMPV